MNTPSDDPLDREIAKLPREVEPRRDLWVGIRAQIEAQSRAWTRYAEAVFKVLQATETYA